MSKIQISHLQPFGILIEAMESISIELMDVDYLKNLFNQHQLILLRGFQTFKNSEAFSNYCDAWGEVCLWPFGKVLELLEQKKPDDHIFDHSYIPLHWDGMYRSQVPEYQIFHCVKAGKGGRTTFSNTILVLENASEEQKKNWSQVTGRYQRKMEFYHSQTFSPLITKHPFRDFAVIRYNEPHQEEKGHFINPPDMEFAGIQDEGQETFHQCLREALYDSKNFYAHEWQEGDVVIADNFSLLHGRESFESQSSRHLQRVQVLSQVPLNNPGLESYQ